MHRLAVVVLEWDSPLEKMDVEYVDAPFGWFGKPKKQASSIKYSCSFSFSHQLWLVVTFFVSIGLFCLPEGTKLVARYKPDRCHHCRVPDPVQFCHCGHGNKCGYHNGGHLLDSGLVGLQG